MKNNILSTSKFLLGWPLSIVAIMFLWRIFTPHIDTLQRNISHSNWILLFVGLLLFQGYFLFRVILWKAILKANGHTVAYKNTAWYWSIAEINRYIPGNIWSVVGRGVTFGRLGISQKTLLFAWVQESILVLFGGSVVGLLGLPVVLFHLLPTIYRICVIVVVSTSVLLISLGWVFQKKLHAIHFFAAKFHKLTIEPSNAFRTLLLSCVSFFFFGLGTYISITALIPLPLLHITNIIGLFALAFVVGYISLVTPMGLGVREVVISEGLLLFLSRSLAGLAALYARVFLIFAELIFLGLSFLFFKKNMRVRQQVLKHISSHIFEYFVGVSIGIYDVYFTVASFLRYTNFFTGRFDLGNMDQTVWNTLHGKIFMLTDPNGTNVMSRLGTHADFILILLAPLYALWEDPRMLLLLQTLVLGFGALFVYLLAKQVIKNTLFAYMVSLAFLLNPSVGYTNLYDFHPVTLATTFFLGAWYFLKQKKYLWTFLFLFLAGCTKEEAWIVVGLFGLYIIFFEKKKLFGTLLTIFSFTTFYLLVWKFIPLARGGQHFALSYYSDFGSTPTSVLKNILFSPGKIIGLLIGPGRLLYLVQLFFPLGFLSLFAPQILIFALPDLGINLLSNNTQLQQISFQYTAIITSFLFLATIYAVKQLTKKYKKIPLYIYTIGIGVSALISAYIYGPFPGALHPNIDMFVKQESDSSIIEGFLQDIPSSFSVAATNNIGSHISHRQKIFTIPVGIDNADIVVFLLNDQFAQPSLAVQKQMAENMKHNKNYVEVFKQGSLVIFEKRNLYTHQEPTIQKGKLYPAAIEALQSRDFEGGHIVIQNTLQRSKNFTSVLFSYPSDGLTLYAKADIPITNNIQQTFPVVIINRGYIISSTFREETSYENIAQAFANAGFIAITPNYRNNGQSDKDTSIVGILAYPIDVLNLINSLPTLKQANTKHVFLWGFSVGGQVTLSTLAAYSQNKNIIPTIQAASVWTPVTDPYMAYVRFHELFPNQQIPYRKVANAFGPFDKNPVLWESISPLFYANDIVTPIRIVDAISDTITPYEWSIELYDDLKNIHTNTQLSLYTNTDHNFTTTWKTVVEGDIAYFKSFLHN